MARPFILVCIFISGGFFIFAPAAAEAAEKIFKVEIGSDAVHAPGLRVWFLSLENPNSRFRYGEAGQEGHDVKFFSVEYVWRVGKWSPSFGIAHVDRLTKLNGTYHNFSLGLQYQVTKNVFLGIVHVSHGSGWGIERNKTNNGFNFITAGTNF